MSERNFAPALADVATPWEQLVARGQNEYVRVDEAVLLRLANENPELTVPDWRFPGQHPANDWAFATQVVLSSIINFSFLNRNRARDGENWQMTDEHGGVLVGSNALHPRFYERFGNAEDVSAVELHRLARPSQFDAFLPDIPLGAERRALMNDFAAGMQRHYEGSVRNVLEASRDVRGDLRLFNNGEGLVERLADGEKFGRAFMDTSYLGDLTFPFNKRANLVPVLIYGRSTTSDTLPQVADISQSGAIPDYRLPQALRAGGAMQYSDELAAMVDNWQPIAAESQMEIEIRAATSYSTARLLEELNALRHSQGQFEYNMAHLDFWLWKMGRELKKQPHTQPPHYTETTAY